jgi:hypothetical protein
MMIMIMATNAFIWRSVVTWTKETIPARKESYASSCPGQIRAALLVSR